VSRTVWYPGHMAKGKRTLSELSGKLDIIIEVRDARAPALTSSPLVDDLARVCPVAVVLSKRDLADERATARWLSCFEESGVCAWALNLLKPKVDHIRRELAPFAPSHREVRLAVVGIPNVGKSMFLNALVGRSSAKVGGIPGITRGVSWYRGRGILAVDSPGILDPKADAETHLRLAWLGCSKAEVIGMERVALGLVSYLRREGLWGVVEEKWGVPAPGDQADQEVLEAVGRRLGCLVPGGVVDLAAAAKRLVDAFSMGRLGQVTLEAPGGRS